MAHKKHQIKNLIDPTSDSGIESKHTDSNNEKRLSHISISAYYKAEARGYEPGHEIQDWLEAEAEISPQKITHSTKL